MKTALLTGHKGFVGRHILPALLEDGWEVGTFDNKSGPSGDCRRIFASDYPFELVIHCAANVGGRKAIERTPLWVAQDYGIDSDFFQYINRIKPKKAIYFSSSAAYPIAYQIGINPAVLNEGMIDHEVPLQPDAVYGDVKIMGEKLALLSRDNGVQVQVFRPFSGYGGDQDLDYPFPSFIERACAHQDPFKIWGTGWQVRDWVHIEDIVRVVMASLDYDTARSPVNIASGIGMTMIDTARLCVNKVGYEMDAFDCDPSEPSGVTYRVGSRVRMERLFGPLEISLDQGIDMALHARRKKMYDA